MRAVHPGEILREDILPSINVSESKLAELLNISRMTVNRFRESFGTTSTLWKNTFLTKNITVLVYYILHLKKEY